MPKGKSILKWSLITISGLIVLIVGFGFWFLSLIPSNESKTGLKETQPASLSYLSSDIPSRGKILAVVTSVDVMGISGKNTGYELTELSRAYYVFQANGFDVDVASPMGGEPAVIIDMDDMGAFDFAFLNDSKAQNKTKNTIPIDSINSEEYEAVFFVGGKGAMFDFPENKKIQSIVRNLYQSNKVIGAVCHGPAALVNVTLDDGSPLLKGKTVTSFTNDEELFLIPDARIIFPFLLQTQLEAQGAKFNEGHRYLEQISHDGNLVTGQNPWSTWALAEAIIGQLGYTPRVRAITAEENTVKILNAYAASGYAEAKTSLEGMFKKDSQSFDRTLIAMHGVISVMDWELGKTYDLIRLLSFAKGLGRD